jgi:hypothetical protein
MAASATIFRKKPRRRLRRPLSTFKSSEKSWKVQADEIKIRLVTDERDGNFVRAFHRVLQ